MKKRRSKSSHPPQKIYNRSFGTDNFFESWTASAVLERITGPCTKGVHPILTPMLIGDHVLMNYFIKSIDENDFPGNFQTNE
jgi:hypothetical protein